jgi:hypothetical protein
MNSEFSPGARWVILLSVSALLLWVSIASVSRGIADFYYYPVKKSFSAWERGKLTQDQAELERIQGLLNQAIAWDANNAVLIEARGRMSDWTSVNMQDRKKYYQHALDDFLSAATLLPSSPWLWMNIALMKARLNQPDALLGGSLVNASRLGPGRNEVARVVVEIGLAGWNRFSQEARQAAMEGVHLVLQSKNGGSFISEAANRHRKKALICQSFRQDPGLAGYCEAR